MQAICNAARPIGQTSVMLGPYTKGPAFRLTICVQSFTARQMRSVYSNTATQVAFSIWGGEIFHFDNKDSITKALEDVKKMQESGSNSTVCIARVSY